MAPTCLWRRASLLPGWGLGVGLVGGLGLAQALVSALLGDLGEATVDQKFCATPRAEAKTKCPRALIDLP